MRMVLQRVKQTSLTADGVPCDQMQQGILALVGIQSGDDQEAVMKYMLDKLVHLRIFEDEQGKMNLSVTDKGYSVFLVSNFTLYGDCRHGAHSGSSPDLRQICRLCQRKRGSARAHRGLSGGYADRNPAGRPCHSTARQR